MEEAVRYGGPIFWSSQEHQRRLADLGELRMRVIKSRQREGPPPPLIIDLTVFRMCEHGPY